MDEPVSKLLVAKDAPLEAVSPHTSVMEAVRRMNERRIGSVMVMDGDRPVGIFTERDVLTRIVTQRIDSERTPVQEVMTRPIITITPTTTVQQAMVIMTDSRCRHLPVVQDGRVVGLISIGDVTRWVVRDQQRTIDDLNDYVCRG